MSSQSRHLPSPPDAIELLLRRALRTALSGSALTTMALGSACSTSHAGIGESRTGVRSVGRDAHADASDVSARAANTCDGGLPGEDCARHPPSVVAAAVTCPPGSSLPIRASGLVTAEKHDYLAIRERNGFPAEAGADAAWSVPAAAVRVDSEAGRPCATATNDACAERIAHHPATFVATACGQVCVELSVVTTRGDDVRRWATAQELRALLGSVDSFDDALLLVSAAGYALSCNDATRTSIREVGDGYVVYATRMTSACAPIVITRYELHVSRQGLITELSHEELTREEGACVGRRPVGLLSRSVDRGRSKLGDFLARCAHLEAASVFAFSRLVRELEAHGAPDALVERVHRAREDEVRHAELVGALARARGGELVPVAIGAMHVRSLEDMAVENAVEGCVRETYGALVGAHQAEHARDAGLRQAMVAIARDEARHASLSHAVHAWLFPKLDDTSRERLHHARARAILELARGLALPNDPELERDAGLPTTRVARRLLSVLMRTLWGDRTRDAACECIPGRSRLGCDIEATAPLELQRQAACISFER